MRLGKTVVIISILLCLILPTAAYAEKWQGTDDLLDQKMQEITGVQAKKPIIDITQGNLGFFVFAVGGFTAGTVFGYQWRKIFSVRAVKKNA